MIATTLIRRYANGFLEYARGTIGFEKGLAELKALKGIFRDTPDFRKLLESPLVSYNEKCGIIEKTLSASFSRESREFLELLLKKGRIEHFVDIAEYARINYEHTDMVDALLDTSYPLDTELMELVKNKVEEKIDKKLHLHVNLDPDLLGCIKISIGNTIIDGSMKERLKELKEKLMNARIG